ncbi:MAG: arginine--tRNA ligase [Nitrospinae bacterium]|nr:arginine--tRNA ligase [Nitrospinota bacterium]
MKEMIRDWIREALERSKANGDLDLPAAPDIVIEEPKDKKLGDYSTAVAMVVAKKERKNPKDVAETLCRYLKNRNENVESIATAGPGFINIKMAASFYRRQLAEVGQMGKDFGRSDIGRNQKVHLEFVSANPTGPLHVGHGRGAAVGHALSSVLRRAGYDVHTEYYINDVGNQMNTLGRSTWIRYREILGSARPEEFPENHYRGEYVNDIAREIMEKYGREFLDKPEEEVLDFFRNYSANSILSGIKDDLKEFRVEYDHWFSERSLFDDDSVGKGVAWMRQKGFIYEKEGAVWLKSSAFKDEKDRVIVKQTGEMTYFCSDIAYHQNKVARGFQRIVNVWGADHHGYVPRMQAVMEALGFDPEAFKILLVQFVTLRRGGEKVSMSTRSGEFITLKDVVSEVGVDAARFFFLMRGSDTHLDFDMELAKKETPENPVFYIQYAYARICNVFKTAEERGVALPDFSEIDLSLLDKDEELELIKKILALPEVVEKSAVNLEVHRIPYYLQELVSIFHAYYNKHRVVTDDRPLTLARLFLLHCLQNAVRSGLDLLGVSAPQRM